MDVTSPLGAVSLRPVGPDDGPRLVQFHQRLSPQSVYRRFFSVHPSLSATEVERFTCVDHVDREALIAQDGDRLVAVGRYERGPGPTEAEIAFVVADEYQHQGIATALLDALAEAAGTVGIGTFVASVLAGNRAMLDVFRHSGFPMRTTTEDGVVTVDLTLVERQSPMLVQGRTSGAGRTST